MNWFARVNGELERGIYLSMAKLSLEHAVEVWWPGCKVVGRKLESEWVGRCWEQVTQWQEWLCVVNYG